MILDIKRVISGGRNRSRRHLASAYPRAVRRWRWQSLIAKKKFVLKQKHIENLQEVIPAS